MAYVIAALPRWRRAGRYRSRYWDNAWLVRTSPRRYRSRYWDNAWLVRRPPLRHRSRYWGKV